MAKLIPPRTPLHLRPSTIRILRKLYVAAVVLLALTVTSAYAIKRVYKQEPPPKEILEEVSAKGGELLSRTTDNFRPPQSREQMTNGNDSDGSGEEERKTPKAEKMDVDDPGSGGGRTTRGTFRPKSSVELDKICPNLFDPRRP